MPGVDSLALQQAHAVEDGAITFEHVGTCARRGKLHPLARAATYWSRCRCRCRRRWALGTGHWARGPVRHTATPCPLQTTLRKLSHWPADDRSVNTSASPAAVDAQRWIVPFCRTWASCLQFRSSASQPRIARVTAGADHCRHERVDRLGTVTDRVGHNTGGLGGLLVAADNKAERVVVAHRCNPANHHCRRIDRHRIAPQCCGIARQCRAARSQRAGAIGKRIACCPKSNDIARVDEWKYAGVVFGRHRRAGRERRLHCTGNRTRRRVSDSRSLRTQTLAIDHAVRRRRTTRLRHCGECDGTARQHYADGSDQAAAHRQTAPRRHVRDNRIMHRFTGERPPSAFSILFI